MRIGILLCAGILSVYGCQKGPKQETGNRNEYPEVSGIYPHLAFYNEEDECGTGAVVPWADRLWVVTYGPHLPYGSSDMLYEITPDLEAIARPESLGGTPAGRFIHRESDQLFIGPYAIGADRAVRPIPYEIMPGRLTGLARHLFGPQNKIYAATMEEGFYEVDVHSLVVRTIQPDAHLLQEQDYGTYLPGAHGKGLYSGQGVLIYTNNGESSQEALERFDAESGSLMEWNGSHWKLIRRNQFTEVTGPGGIYGNPDPENDPLWSIGWDHKSLLLGVRVASSGTWHFYRLPKASHSYDGAHGWNTEWPRIRDVGMKDYPDYLMTMHGMFWRFPPGFTTSLSAGIRPRSAYLKVIGDFTRWNDRLVMGCDDAARREFLNKRGVKGELAGPGQSNSNLWFLEPERLDQLGPTHAEGGIWQDEEVRSGEPSDPFLIAGWPSRVCWIHHSHSHPVSFTFEADRDGNGKWRPLFTLSLDPGRDTMLHIPEEEKIEWIRVRPGQNAEVTLHFCFSGKDSRGTEPDSIFQGLAGVGEREVSGGLLYALGEGEKALGMAGVGYRSGESFHTGYYELNGGLRLNRVNHPEREAFIQDHLAIPTGMITADSSSVLVVDDRGRRWRLPLGDQRYTDLTEKGVLRLSREVVTERDLFSCHGTFYELPAENADGFAKIRPISSHSFRINDYCSFRGLMVISGVSTGYNGSNPRIIRSGEGDGVLWVGAIDDLWKLGRPRGHGGPWLNTPLMAGEVSDPYLIGFYDERSLELTHRESYPVTFVVEADPVGNGHWMHYLTFRVPPGEKVCHRFPGYFQARWIRFRVNEPSTATAILEYH